MESGEISYIVYTGALMRRDHATTIIALRAAGAGSSRFACLTSLDTANALADII